jgi:hypothetical protein
MPVVAYADESLRGGLYIVAVTLVSTSDRQQLEKSTRRLLMPGQRRIHMKSERDSRRRHIISTLVDLKTIEAWVYLAPRPAVPARNECIRSLVVDLLDVGVSELVLDQTDHEQARRDRATIQNVVAKERTKLSYMHSAPVLHAGLQAADVIAWAYGAGGDWRRRVLPMIDRVRKLNK